MKRVVFWVTVFAGATAAYLMYRRGVPPVEIVQKALGSPITALESELKAV